MLQVPGYPSWYNIVYKEDTAVYTYELEKDLDQGDLQILIEQRVFRGYGIISYH